LLSVLILAKTQPKVKYLAYDKDNNLYL